MKLRCGYCLVFIVIAGVCAAPGASVWINMVPPAYPTIQAAVDAAGNQTMLCLSTNVFVERVVITNKSISFQGGYDSDTPAFRGGYSVIDAAGVGGAMTFIRATSSVENIIMRNGYRGGDGGGGANLVSSYVQFSNCHFDNHYGLNGGGLYVNSSSVAYLFNGVTFSNCQSRWGGAAFVAGLMEAYMGSRFVGNTSTNDGGAIYVWAGGFFSGGDILLQSNKTLSAGRGGAICAASNANLLLSGGCVLQGNRAANDGGGIWVDHASVTLRDVVLRDNTAGLSGGGICARDVPLFFMGSAGNHNLSNPSNVLQGNVALYGGALYISNSPSIISNVLVVSNMAQYGGGIYMVDCNPCSTMQCGRIVGNQALNPGISFANGGGFYMDNSALLLRDTDVEQNHSDGHGGGGIAYNPSRLSIEAISHVSVFDYNTAARDGGGLYMDSTNALSLSGVFPLHFSDNIASGSGSGLFANTLFATGRVYFINNHCASNGAGGYVLNRADLYGGNTPLWFEQNTAGGNGGGLYIGPEGSIYLLQDITSALVNVTFDKNSAIGGSGGGVYLRARSAHIGPASFTTNYSGQYGGGLAVQEAPWLLVGSDMRYFKSPTDWPTWFSGNEASFGGGGVYLDDCTRATIRLSAIVSNRSSSSGGGIAARACRFDLLDAVVAGNYHLGIGVTEGLHIQSCTGWIEHCTVVDNDGFGLWFTNAGYNINHTIAWGHPSGQFYGNSITTRYCCVQNGWPGAGNITNNPRLYANYHLRYDSPCIEAGEAAGGSYDVDGEFRLFMKDIGCDEFIDTDLDLLPNIVETLTGVWQSELDAGTSWLQSDTDNDGNPDGDEWIADTNPNQSNDVLKLASVTYSNDLLWLTWQGGRQASRVLEFQAGLAGTDSWMQILTEMPPTAVTTTVGVLVYPQDRYYYRVRAYR